MNPDELEIFKDNFIKNYLNINNVSMAELYKIWSERDKKYFAQIASPLVGIRCLRQDPWECTLSFICS